MKKAKLFLLGSLAAAVVFSSIPALATAINAAFNAINITYNGNAVATVGQNYTLPNGTQTPFSIVYNGTTYLPVRKVSEILNVPIGWDSNTKTVKIGNDTTQAETNEETTEEIKLYSETCPVPDFKDIFNAEEVMIPVKVEKITGHFYSTKGLPDDVTSQYQHILEKLGWEFTRTMEDSRSSEEYYKKYVYEKVVEGKEFAVIFGYGYPSSDNEYEVYTTN